MRFKTLVFSLAALAAAIRPAAAADAQSSSTAAVTLDGRPVLVLSGRELFLTARERAQRVSDRLRKLARDPISAAETITVAEGENSSDILAGDLVLMSVTDADALAAGAARQDLAAKDAELIRRSVTEYRRNYNIKSVLLGALLALLSGAAFIWLLGFIARAHTAALPRLEAWGQANIRSIKIQQLELVNARRITGTITLLLQALRALATLLLIYFYIPLLFSFFPWTRGLSPVLFGYVLHPLASLLKSFFGYIPDMIFIAVTVAVMHYLLKLLHLVAGELEAGHITLSGFYPDWAKPTFQIIRFITWAFTLVIIFPYLPGSDSPAFKGVSVFLGVLFSLGSSSAISNAVAGIMLTYMRPFKPGDRVEIGETTGDVMEKTLLVTRVKTIKNVTITMPNALVLSSHMINYSARADNEGVILHTSVTIGYDAPWPKVHELLVSAAQATGMIMREPKPFVLQTALNDFNVSYELNAYTDEPEKMAKIYSDLHTNIQDKFNAAGVEIMSPHYASLRDGNAPAMPGAGPGKAAFKVNLSKEGA